MGFERGEAGWGAGIESVCNLAFGGRKATETRYNYGSVPRKVVEKEGVESVDRPVAYFIPLGFTGS